MVSNKTRTVLYTGVTAQLYTRAYQHKYDEGTIFTKKYKCTALVYFEFHSSIEEAIRREKQIKKWKREWKENLIRSINPGFDDLFDQVSEMN